jgi:hypothetical protein
VDDGVNMPVRQNLPHKIAVSYVALVNERSATERGYIRPLDGWIIEIIKI